jgi:type IV fimbrial biogenesis protein FimT
METIAGDVVGSDEPQLQNRKAAGFTLVELMIVLGIAAILLTMAVPSFSALIQNLQMTTTVNDLFAAINLTRSEAIKRGTRVDLATVNPDSDWEDGWVVFVDKNANLRPDAGDEIILEHGPIRGGIEITSNLSGSARRYLSYNGTGRTRTDASRNGLLFGNFAFIVDGETRRRISINALGRPRVCNPAAESSC